MGSFSHQAVRKSLAGLTLLDDVFASAALDGNRGAVQHILRTIMRRDDLTVTGAKAQTWLAGTKGKSVRLDVQAEDRSGDQYDIEIQRKKSGATPLRGRGYQSLIDANLLHAGDRFERLPRVSVVFVCERDPFGRGKGLYRARTYLEDELAGQALGPLDDRRSVWYFDTSHPFGEEHRELGRLAHDFRCARWQDIYNPCMREAVMYIKENDEGTKRYDGLVDRLVQAGRKEGFRRGEKLGQARGEKLGQARGEKLGQARGEKLGQARGEKLGQARGAHMTLTRNVRSLLGHGQSPAQVAYLLDLDPAEVERLAFGKEE